MTLLLIRDIIISIRRKDTEARGWIVTLYIDINKTVPRQQEEEDSGFL